MPRALKPVLITAPEATPVSLAEIKADRRIDHDYDDAELTRLLKAATAYLDGWRGVLGFALVTQTWRAAWDGFPCGDTIRLPFGPVASITSVAYWDTEGTEQTLATSVWAGPFEDDLGPFIALKPGQSWPGTTAIPDAVSVTFVAGTLAAQVPEDIRDAILKLAGHWFENREAVVIGASVRDVPLTVQSVIDAHRVSL